MRLVPLLLVFVLLALPGLHAASRPVHDVGAAKSPHRLSFARVPWAASRPVAVTVIEPSERQPLPPVLARLPLIAKSVFVPPEA
jgi:hypothetical protein